MPQIGNKPYKVKETIKPVSPTRSYSQQNVISSNSLNYNNGNSTLILYDSAAQSEGGNYRLLYQACDVCEHPILVFLFLSLVQYLFFIRLPV